MKTFFALALLVAAPLAAADLSGTWTLDGQVAGNVVKGACVLKQEGSRITGVCKLNGKADADATGEATQDKVIFQHQVEHNGATYTLEYDGKKVSDTEFKGDIKVLNQSESGNFTAKKA